MKCPKCGTTWICVLESRHTSVLAISRRRQCKACDHVWATAEVVVPDGSISQASSTKKWGGFKIKDEVIHELAETADWFAQA